MNKIIITLTQIVIMLAIGSSLMHFIPIPISGTIALLILLVTFEILYEIGKR